MWDINMQGYIVQITEPLYGCKINLVLQFDQKLGVLNLLAVGL